MCAKRFIQTVAVIAVLVVLVLFPASVSAQAYRLTVAGERLEFVAQPEKGYVVKLRVETQNFASLQGGIEALGGVSALDAEDAIPVGGLDRRGVWTVENEGPAGRNEGVIRALRAGGQVAYAAPLFSSNGETVAIIPEIVVRVRLGTAIEQVQQVCKTAGCAIKKRMEFTEQEYLLEVQGPDAEAVFMAVERLGQAPEVEWACPNTAFRPRLPAPSTPASVAFAGELWIAAAGQDANRPGVFPNDEYFPRQWHLHNTGQSGGTPGADIRAPEAWEITIGDPNIVVAVIDSGVDTNHPDLMANLLAGYDFYEDDNEPDPAFGRWGDAHGTACAGLIAAKGDNRIGIAGVAYDCKIMPIRDGDATNLITQTEEATAFRWAATQGACVFSFSTVLTNVPIIHSAVQDVTKPAGIGRNGKGCVALFAAGNWGQPIQAGSTARYPEVITVGATDHNDQRCWYSSYGPELDISAPGGGGIILPNVMETKYIEQFARFSKGLLWTTDILGDVGFSTFNEDPNVLDYTEKFAGTSAACPVAAGVAALILSIEPNLTSNEVRHFLERSAKDLGDPGRDDYYGWGRVDARAALDMVLAKRADLNDDWVVDEKDRVILLKAMEAKDLSADIAPAKKRDGVVDAQDLELLTRYLGTVIPEMGLITHWKLDEKTGGTAYDSVGKNNATVLGTAGWQPEGGKVGGALQLSGVANFAITGFVRDPAEGPFSVFAWVKGGAPGQVILSQAKGANWLMAAAPGGALATELKESGRNGKPLLSQTPITDGDWHRVGLVWDGSNRILYVDGLEAARDTQSALTPADGGLYLGAGSTPTPGTLWKGLIDDVRIYDRAVKP